MACITLTRITLPGAFGAPPASGWDVAYEGRHVATYAEEADGWLRQIRASRPDASLGSYVGARSFAREYPSLDELREAYLLRARTWDGV